MNIEFGTSNRGRLIFLYQGYEYVKKQETNTTTHWICRHYRQIKCSSLVITSGSEIIKTPKDHICNFKPGATEARQAKNKMKEKALPTTNYVAIASTLQEIQNDVATQMNLPPQETIVKSLNRYKRKFANALPHIPHGKDFQIPEEFKDFVAFDKGKVNLKDSSYLPWQRCFFCLRPQRTYGLVTEPSSNVRTCFTNTSRAPLFEPSISNQNNAASEGLARTNNAVEGWHYGIQSLFSGSHLDVWTFLQKFRQDALLHKFNAIQAVTGHQKKPHTKYQQLNARVQTLINSYDENKQNIIPFLRSIAHLQWLIDTICYSSYSFFSIVCFRIFSKKNAIFQKVVRIESPNFGACLLVFNVGYYFAFDARTARCQSNYAIV